MPFEYESGTLFQEQELLFPHINSGIFIISQLIFLFSFADSKKI